MLELRYHAWLEVRHFITMEEALSHDAIALKLAMNDVTADHETKTQTNDETGQNLKNSHISLFSANFEALGSPRTGETIVPCMIVPPDSADLPEIYRKVD